jgi:long-chain acyl-CoA synthetase
MIHYDYFAEACKSINMVNPAYEGDEYVSYMSPAWITENFLGLAQWLNRRTVVNFPEEPETVQENIREIGPATLLLGARQWESLISMVQMKMADAGLIQRLVFSLCMPFGYRIANYKFKQRRPPSYWRFLYLLADWVCFRHIRDNLGLRRLRVAATGGAPLGPDVMTWFHAIGVNIKQFYGLTELVMMACHGDIVKPGTVGDVCEGVTIKISDDGEILATNAAPFRGYYKDPDETARVMDGIWLKTGDAGSFDEHGQLIVIDRVKELLTLKGGEKYSPTFIENRLKFSPFIKDAIVFGEGKDYVFAIINIDFDNVGRWAEKHRVSYTTYVDLSQKGEINELIRAHVDTVNKTLPPKARLQKYVILHKEFDPDEGELTRTRKLRRALIKERYSKVIDTAYAGEEKLLAEAEVRYRDGRTGKVTTELKIRRIELEDL